jgi:hypothetical protein
MIRDAPPCGATEAYASRTLASQPQFELGKFELGRGKGPVDAHTKVTTHSTTHSTKHTATGRRVSTLGLQTT